MGTIVRTIALGLLVTASGCAPSTGAHDDVQDVLASVIASATQGTRDDVCVDDRTKGEPLAIFRTMAVAPDPARRPLLWRAPTPLGGGQDLTGRQLIDGEYDDASAVLAEPGGRAAALPAPEQIQLNAYARQLSGQGTSRTAIAAPPPAKVIIRWWLANRLSRSCTRTYRLTNPVFARDVAFVTVTAGHWGSTFAVRRLQGRWQPWARWSDWLY